MTGLKSFIYFALSALGVIGGTTCCISLPFLISLLATATAIVSQSVAVHYVAYVVFPIATDVGLKLNMDSISKISKIVTPVHNSGTWNHCNELMTKIKIPHILFYMSAI